SGTTQGNTTEHDDTSLVPPVPCLFCATRRHFTPGRRAARTRAAAKRSTASAALVRRATLALLDCHAPLQLAGEAAGPPCARSGSARPLSLPLRCGAAKLTASQRGLTQ